MPKQIPKQKQKRASQKFPAFLLALVRKCLEHLAPNETRSKEPFSEEFNPYHLDPELLSPDDVKKLMSKYHKKGLTIKNLQNKLIKAHEKNRKFHEQLKELKARIAELEALPESSSAESENTS